MAYPMSVLLLCAMMATVSFAVPEDKVPTGQLGSFDYINNTQAGQFGGTSAPSATQLPSQVGTGMTSIYVTIEPCALLLPHNHPRAAEFLYVTKGSLQIGLVDEFGSTPGGGSTLTLNAGDGTVFPQGLLHYQQNTGCAQASFYSVLNSEQPGTNFFPTSYLALAPEALGASLGVSSLSAFNSLLTKVPSVFGPSSASACAQRCGLAPSSAPVPSGAPFYHTSN